MNLDPIAELEEKLRKLRKTAQGNAFQLVWPASARSHLIAEILDTQRRLDVMRQQHGVDVACVSGFAAPVRILARGA